MMEARLLKYLDIYEAREERDTRGTVSIRYEYSESLLASVKKRGLKKGVYGEAAGEFPYENARAYIKGRKNIKIGSGACLRERGEAPLERLPGNKPDYRVAAVSSYPGHMEVNLERIRG